MEEIKIDIELKTLLPELDQEKEKLLEEDILKNGCISPIILWNGYIVDGHHRFKICQRNGLEFKTKEMQFENKQEAMIWAWTTQRARRNIDDGVLFNIAKVFGPYYEKKAKEQQGKRTDLFQKSEKSCAKEEVTFLSNDKNVVDTKGFIKCENLNIENTNNTLYMKSDKALKEKIGPVNTTKELADIAGTSQSTMNKVIQTQKHAPEIIQRAVSNNGISINKGYEITKQVKNLQGEEKEDKAFELLNNAIEEKLNREDKEEDRLARKANKINSAIYDATIIEVNEENVGYWLKGKNLDDIKWQEKNVDEAIEKFQEIKRLMQEYKGIRRAK